MNTRGRQPALVTAREAGLPASRRLPNHTLSELLAPISVAIDLAEGRQPGHAQRVAYIAAKIAAEMELDNDQRLACLYAALMHDLGVIPAGAGLSQIVHGDERRIFSSLPSLSPEEAAIEVDSDAPDLVVERVIDHSLHGARLALELGLPQEAARAIACHHEQWDGSGYPYGLAGNEIPVAARVTSVADQLESLIAGEQSPLHARRNIRQWLGGFTASVADAELVAATRRVATGDAFWLGIFGTSLQNELRLELASLKEPRTSRLLPFAERFAQVMDARFPFTVGDSARVAGYAESLGRCAGLPEHRLKLLRLAALLHDVGMLGVPERIMAKPGILSVDELDVLRQHPQNSREVISGIPGLEEVAEWVGAHHEWPDGRGYPEGRSSEDIPVEARILAIADAYVSVTSDRPHRRRAERDDAIRRLRGAAGTQLDPDLLSMFIARVVA